MTYSSEGAERKPFFSICIPQYNRTSFLLESLRSLQTQTFQDFEVCVSDGGSDDGGTQDILKFLETSGLRYTFERHPVNLRYDPNLRGALGLASGSFCILMGNDDSLASDTVLCDLAQALKSNCKPGVLIPNFADYRTGAVTRRVIKSRDYEGTPRTAVEHYRNLAFVSGLILIRDRAQAHATDAWDGSEMYQMFLASRIIAEGYELLERDYVAVRKDIQISGQLVDNYARWPRIQPCKIIERRLPFMRLGRVVCDAVRPFTGSVYPELCFKVFWQLLCFSYAPWIVEYRRVQSWKYAAGVCLAMRPRNILQGIALGWQRRVMVRVIYSIVTLAGLLVPIPVFDCGRQYFYRFAKSLFVKAAGF